MATFTDLLAMGPTRRFQPSQSYQQASDSTEMLEHLARLVGYVAFGLPIVLAIFGPQSGCFRDSISHFYYAPLMGAVFVGCLFFISGFLIAYRGENAIENWGSTLAGIGAAIVAALPTTDPGCEAGKSFTARVFTEVKIASDGMLSVDSLPDGGFFKLFEGVSNFHLGAAAIVFIYLALYCFFVLSRIVPERHERDGSLIASKRRRNIVYKICGTIILICVAVLGLKARFGSDAFIAAWDRGNWTFWFEALALWAFGFSWVVKGRLVKYLND